MRAEEMNRTLEQRMLYTAEEGSDNEEDEDDWENEKFVKLEVYRFFFNTLTVVFSEFFQCPPFSHDSHLIVCFSV